MESPNTNRKKVTPLNHIGELTLLIGIYTLAAALVSGIRGGIRDGMEGIGDTLFIIGWPVVVVFWFLTVPLRTMLLRDLRSRWEKRWEEITRSSGKNSTDGYE